jgi:hypothetical protein
MKARILNNNFQGIYTDDFIESNFNNIINGQLVSEWELTDISPNKTLLKPIWNVLEWIEGATPEEIAEQENQQKQELKRQAHDELLPTDWYVVRFIERGIPIPEEITQQRQAILDKYNT